MMSIRHTRPTVALFVLGLAGVLASAPVGAQAGRSVTATDAWIRMPMPAGKDTAFFAIVDNHGVSPRAIVAAASEVAETVELHEMKMDNGMMRMSQVKRIDVPAGGRVELKPGGLHVMLFGLRKTLSAGDAVTLTLTFDDGTALPVLATVRAMEKMR